MKTQVICEQVSDGWEQWVLGTSKDNLLLYRRQHELLPAAT